MKDIVIRLNTREDMQIKFNSNQIVGFQVEEDSALIEITFIEKNKYGTADYIKIPVSIETLNGIREIMGLSCIG